MSAKECFEIQTNIVGKITKKMKNSSRFFWLTNWKKSDIIKKLSKAEVKREGRGVRKI